MNATCVDLRLQNGFSLNVFVKPLARFDDPAFPASKASLGISTASCKRVTRRSAPRFRQLCGIHAQVSARSIVFLSSERIVTWQRASEVEGRTRLEETRRDWRRSLCKGTSCAASEPLRDGDLSHLSVRATSEQFTCKAELGAT